MCFTGNCPFESPDGEVCCKPRWSRCWTEVEEERIERERVEEELQAALDALEDASRATAENLRKLREALT